MRDKSMHTLDLLTRRGGFRKVPSRVTAHRSAVSFLSATLACVSYRPTQSSRAIQAMEPDQEGFIGNVIRMC